MKELLKTAFELAEKMEIISSQQALLQEEYLQNLIYYTQGGSFTVSKELIVFVKTLVDLNNFENTVIVDDNDTPIKILDLKEFLKDIMDCYFTATNEYYTKYSELTRQTPLEKLVALDE